MLSTYDGGSVLHGPYMFPHREAECNRCLARKEIRFKIRPNRNRLRQSRPQREASRVEPLVEESSRLSAAAARRHLSNALLIIVQIVSCLSIDKIKSRSEGFAQFSCGAGQSARSFRGSAWVAVPQTCIQRSPSGLHEREPTYKGPHINSILNHPLQPFNELPTIHSADRQPLGMCSQSSTSRPRPLPSHQSLPLCLLLPRDLRPLR